MDSLTENNASQTPGEIIIGWVLLFLSFMVMACGYKECQVNTIFWIGVAIIPIGTVFILIGKRKQKK